MEFKVLVVICNLAKVQGILTNHNLSDLLWIRSHDSHRLMAIRENMTAIWAKCLIEKLIIHKFQFFILRVVISKHIKVLVSLKLFSLNYERNCFGLLQNVGGSAIILKRTYIPSKAWEISFLTSISYLSSLKMFQHKTWRRFLFTRSTMAMWNSPNPSRPVWRSNNCTITALLVRGQMDNPKSFLEKSAS